MRHALLLRQHRTGCQWLLRHTRLYWLHRLLPQTLLRLRGYLLVLMLLRPHPLLASLLLLQALQLVLIVQVEAVVVRGPAPHHPLLTRQLLLPLLLRLPHLLLLVSRLEGRAHLPGRLPCREQGRPDRLGVMSVLRSCPGASSAARLGRYGLHRRVSCRPGGRCLESQRICGQALAGRLPVPSASIPQGRLCGRILPRQQVRHAPPLPATRERPRLTFPPPAAHFPITWCYRAGGTSARQRACRKRPGRPAPDSGYAI